MARITERLEALEAELAALREQLNSGTYETATAPKAKRNTKAKDEETR